MAEKLEYSVVAKCRPEHVWQKFAKIEQWPWWNRVIGRAAWVRGEAWKPGSAFEYEIVRPREAKVKPVIIAAEPPTKVAWAAKSFTSSTRQSFSFEAQPDGSTMLKSSQEFSGLGSKGARDAAEQVVKDWFELLKAEAEKIAREEAARA